MTPAYNEEANVPLLYEAVKAVFAKKDMADYDCELIYVDDGSRDGTAAAIDKLTNTKNLTVKFVRFSRNFGKEAAVSAGMQEVTGEAVVILDVDMQHPPAYIPDFVRRWEAGADVVVGVRSQDEHEGLIKSWGSKLFYILMARISDVDIVPRSTDFRLLDRHVVNEFNRFTERSRINRGLIDWLGFDREYIEFKPDERATGTPAYSTKKLINLALNSITSHSMAPLRFAGYLGVGLTLFAGLLGVFIIFENYVFHDAMQLKISNVAMLAIFTVFLMGMVLSSLGLIARYIEAIHAEVFNRPLYVVRRKRGGNDTERPIR